MLQQLRKFLPRRRRPHMTQSGHGEANFAVMHNRATLRILCGNQSESTVNSQSLRQTPLQWEIVALIKALNVVAIEAFVTDLPPGDHGFHVHVNPDCGPGNGPNGQPAAGMAAGGHYDPANTGKHLGPNGEGHKGDMPVLTVDAR